MATLDQYYNSIRRREALRRSLADLQASERPTDVEAAEIWNNQLMDLEESQLLALENLPSPVDGGLADLIGIGPGVASGLSGTTIPPRVEAFDDAVTSTRVLAVADLYYIYEHDVLGVFRAVQRLQALYRAGTVRLSSGPGAFQLYRYDRRMVLRYSRKERLQAYRRVLGYTDAPPPDGARPNQDFHALFERFNREVAGYYRDKRISQVIRDGSQSRTFGSVPAVRRAGLNLRQNLRGASYGHVNVLVVELSQLLRDAFDILGAPDVRNLFGASDAWDSFESIMKRYENSDPPTSARSRMAANGRRILQWLASPNVLERSEKEFELLLDGIGTDTEEWLTSAASLKRGAAAAKVVPLRRKRA